MSQDPLQKLWQSQQLEISTDEIMKQAKKRQKRMFWLMFSDIVMWFALVIWASWIIHQNKHPESFAVGLFMILAVSIFVGYVLWLRTMTWGMDSLDVRNTLKLSIRRCQAGIQMGYVSVVFCLLVAVGLFVIMVYYPERFGNKSFGIAWTLGWSAVVLVGALWYRNRQNKKIAHFQSLLEQLENSQENNH